MRTSGRADKDGHAGQTNERGGHTGWIGCTDKGG